MARTLAQKVDAIKDMCAEVRKANEEIRKLEKMPNSAATLLLITAAKLLLAHLIKKGVARMAAARKKKT